jgi:hypothetical protein
MVAPPSTMNNQNQQQIILQIDISDNFIPPRPVLRRENYMYLPWNHRTFESWQQYVQIHGDENGFVYPSSSDSYTTYIGYSMNDWDRYRRNNI